MATMMAPVEQREVVRCDNCSLVQFRTVNMMCRRCRKSLEVEEPEPAPAPISIVPTQPAADGGLQVATAVRDLRHVRNLSQRQLAELCGTTQSSIARLERGGRPPRIDTLLRIADALDCELVVELAPRK